MQSKLNYRLICFALVLLSFGNWISDAQECPEVTFHYTYIPFDRWCSEFNQTEVKDIWINELYSKMDTFINIWNDRGAKLLKATVQEVGKPFEKKEIQATMTLCRSRSMSHPLLIGMQKYLDTSTNNNPRDLNHFVATVFHEILHIYVFDLLRTPEHLPLLEKYKNEPNSVRNHLHLMAIIKHVYLKLGWKNELNSIIESNKQTGQVYERSWQIVNNEENYMTFIKELNNL